MLSKQKCYQNWNISHAEMSTNLNVTKTEMPPKIKHHQNWYITKSEMTLNPKSHQNWNFTAWNVTKTEISKKWDSPKPQYHLNLNFNKTKMSVNLKCHQKWNVTKTEMLDKLKCPQYWSVTRSFFYHNQIYTLKLNFSTEKKEIGTNYLGPVYNLFLNIFNRVWQKIRYSNTIWIVRQNSSIRIQYSAYRNTKYYSVFGIWFFWQPE